MFQYYNRSFSRLGATAVEKKKLANIFLERNPSKIVTKSIWPWCSVKLMFSDAEISMKYHVLLTSLGYLPVPFT